MLADTVISETTNKHIHVRHVCNRWIYGSGSVIKVLKTGHAVYSNTDPRPENRLTEGHNRGFQTEYSYTVLLEHSELMKCRFIRIWDANRISHSRITKIRVKTFAANTQQINYVEF